MEVTIIIMIAVMAFYFLTSEMLKNTHSNFYVPSIEYTPKKGYTWHRRQ